MRIGREAVELFEALLELPDTQRMAALTSRTAGRPDLRHEVERLLQRDAEQAGIEISSPLLGRDFHLLRALDAASRPIRSFPKQVGRYVLQGELGMGAMGIVYRAEQDQPRRLVALKLLLRGKDDALDQQVFRTEMQALAQVRHPGIVQIHDAGVLEFEGGRFPFLAMELVEGDTLLAWERKATPDRATRLSVMVALCSAIEAAHQRGVIHRDLKPENIVVDVSGPVPMPRVLDFGIARLARATSGIGPAGGVLLVGTPAYMSPEQAAGRVDVDTRSDVHALGAIAYRLLTGKEALACSRDSLEEVLRAVREHVPAPLSTHDARLAGDIELVIAKALAKDPEQRHASAHELGQDLENVLRHRPVSARPHTSWYLLRCLVRREPWMVAAATLGLLLVGALVAQQHRDAVRAEGDLSRFVRQSRQNIVRILDPLGHLAIAGPARREILEQMLPELEAALMVRPADPELLQTVYDVLRLLGDIVVDAGEHDAALGLRLRALAALDERLRITGVTAGTRAERATALVRVGDVLAFLHDMPAARDHYRAAHEEFAALQAAAPGDERHLDDLAWSCDRMARLALAMEQLGEAEALLATEEQTLIALGTMHPHRPGNQAALFALHCLSATLADKRQDPRDALHHHEEAIRFARIRFQLEPGSRPAIIDLAAALLSHVHRSGPAIDDALAAAELQEAVRVLDGLLEQDGNHRVGRKLLLWARYVPRIREAARTADPVETPLRQAGLYLEHLRAARSLLHAKEVEEALDWVGGLLDDVPVDARNREDHRQLVADLAAARSEFGPSAR